MRREGILAPLARAPHCGTVRWSCSTKHYVLVVIAPGFNAYPARTASPRCPSCSLAGAETSQPIFCPARPSVKPCLRNISEIDETKTRRGVRTNEKFIPLCFSVLSSLFTHLRGVLHAHRRASSQNAPSAQGPHANCARPAPNQKVAGKWASLRQQEFLLLLP